jgi:vancomycin permeability regulator SanA
MAVKSKWITAGLSIFLLIIHLLLLYFIKYKNQDLPLSLFNLNNIGNILNLIFTTILLIGIIISFFKGNKTLQPSTILIYLIVLTVLMFVCALTLVIEIPKTNFYVLEQPFSEFVITAVFSSYQFIQFVIISVVWLDLFTGKGLIFLRALLNSVIIVVLLFIFSYLYLDIQKSDKVETKNPENTLSIAIVLGAAVWSHNEPSPSLASRIDKAAELYKKGVVNKIQLTGSNAPGELSEAEVAWNYLISKGIDDSNIWVEKNTTSTAEQIHFIKYNLLSGNKFGNVIIISDEYHLTRVKEISKFYDVNAKVEASELALSFEKKVYYKIRECIALLIFWCFAL